MRLDIEELVKERIALRRKLGIGFLEDGGFDIREHLKKSVLFLGRLVLPLSTVLNAPRRNEPLITSFS